MSYHLFKGACNPAMGRWQEALESDFTSCDKNVKSCSCSDTNDVKPLVAGLSQVMEKILRQGKVVDILMREVKAIEII